MLNDSVYFDHPGNGEDLVCVYHDQCNDGLVSAYCVRERYPNARFYPASYETTDIPSVNSDDVVLIVDFSFGPDDLKKLADQCRGVVVLDHHKAAIEQLEGFKHPKVEMVLDVDRAGAMLTWDVLHDPSQQKEVPPIVAHSNDYDLWEFKIPGTQEFVRYMYSRPYEISSCDEVGFTAGQARIDAAISKGRVLTEDDERQTQQIIDTCTRIINVGEHRFPIPVVNAPRHLTSLIGNMLAKDYWFAMVYVDNQDGRKIRFNSVEESSIECDKLAGLFNGGGHRKSAGCSVSHDLPWSTIQSILSSYVDSLTE